MRSSDARYYSSRRGKVEGALNELMSRAKAKRMDSLEKAIEAALAGGNFIAYKAAWEFVEGLQRVADRVGELIASEPDRAARLFAAFISACHEKADEVDDFLARFDRIAAGVTKPIKPTLLERAKRRWPS